MWPRVGQSPLDFGPTDGVPLGLLQGPEGSLPLDADLLLLLRLA